MTIISSRHWLLVLLVAFAPSRGPAQQTTLPTMALRAAYTTFDLEEIREILSVSVAAYRSYGVPVNLQVDFPANILVGIEYQVPIEGGRTGISAAYTNTMSYFGFKDAAGLLRVRSDVRMITLQSALLVDLITLPSASVDAAFRPGGFIAMWNTEEEVSFTMFPHLGAQSRLKTYAYGFVFEPSAGVTFRPMDDVIVRVEGGYRYSPDASLRKDGEELSVQLDVSGFVGGLTVAVELR